jgi:hypothetical protein
MPSGLPWGHFFSQKTQKVAAIFLTVSRIPATALQIRNSAKFLTVSRIPATVKNTLSCSGMAFFVLYFAHLQSSYFSPVIDNSWPLFSVQKMSLILVHQ